MTRGLAPAQRARTIVATSTAVTISAGGESHPLPRHVVTPDGSLLLRPPPGTEEPGVDPVCVTLVDLTDVPQPDRVRGTLRLTGRLEPVAGPLPVDVRAHLASAAPGSASEEVVRLRPHRVELSWRCEGHAEGHAEVWHGIETTEYAVAQPDPMVAHEAEWLPHLMADHATVLRALAEVRLGDLAEADVRPIVLDRLGLVLRLYRPSGHEDLRLAFSSPVACGCEVRAEFNALLSEVAPLHPDSPGWVC